MRGMKYVVSAEEIFTFAALHEGLTDTQCREIFYAADVLTNLGWNQFVLAEIVHNDGLAWEILTAFMVEEELPDMIVISD